MKFAVEYQRVATVEARSLDEALSLVHSGQFDPISETLPLVLNIERVEGKEDDEDEDEDDDGD